MTLKEIEEVKKQFTKYMGKHNGYWRSSTNEVSSIVSRLNKLTFKQRSQLVNNSIDFEKLCDDETKVKKFDKFLTLEEIPNTFMSNTFLDCGGVAKICGLFAI